MDLLFVLAADAGQVVTREQLMASLWPGLVMGEDSLARTVSKLRQALGDDAKAPQYIETIAKRGYRLRAQVETAAPLPTDVTVDPVASPRRAPRPGVIVLGMLAVLALAWAGVRIWSGSAPVPAADGRNQLVSRADDYYFQFSRADNESAIELYQRVLGLHPDDAPALAGLANALAQRSIRWPQGAEARAGNSPGWATRWLPGICNANPPASNCSAPGNWPSARWCWHPIPQRRTRRWVSC